MPTPEKSMLYFAFSIATGRGTTRGGLGDLMGEMMRAGVTLHSLSGFVSGRRTKLFCVPGDADAFRAFAKKRKLRLSEKTAVKLTYSPTVMALLHRRAISGDDFPAFSISTQTGFVYLPEKRH